MKMPSRILRDKVNMEVIKPWITISWACCTVSVYHVASSERCILMVGAKIPYNTRFFRRRSNISRQTLENRSG